nr:ArsR family transcriptional regulator [Myxococcota bacterium]
ARECAEVLAAIDARRAPPPALADWACTRTIDAPPSAHGLCVQVLEDASEQAEAVLLAVPARSARRVLGLGARLLEAPGVRVFQKTRRRQGRVETMIAVLLSAGAQGMDEGACFAATYELTFEPELHRGVFDVLVTRARAHLDGAGEIVRSKGRMVLEHSGVLVVPDPRCAAPVHDRLLRILARTGKASANDAARSTGLAVRTVQDALKALADEGVCELEREGRHLVYSVEDTTFSEATERFAREREP